MRDTSVHGYDLACPTAAELGGALTSVLGQRDADSALRLALRDLGTPTNQLSELAPDRLLALALALTGQRGLPAVIGRSFAIRMSTYFELQQPEESHHDRI